MAADQIEILLPKSRVPEESAFTLTVYFRDRSTGLAATPNTIEYQVDDLTTQSPLITWTSVTPATSVTITIPSTVNQIKQNSSHYERKQILVQTDRLLSTKSSNSAIWQVKNVFGINVG